MEKEFQALREKIEKLVADIVKIKHRFIAKREALQKAVDEYSTKRVDTLFEKFRSKKKTWCTLCATYFRNHTRRLTTCPEEEIKLLFTEDKHMTGGGSHYGSPESVFYSNLHRACPKCLEKALDLHGTHGSNSFFHAFKVEQREDGYYARRFGQWVKLDDKECEFPEFPDSSIEPLAEELSKEFKLPPKIEIKSEELVIHE